jgi:hypothetical protein
MEVDADVTGAAATIASWFSAPYLPTTA